MLLTKTMELYIEYPPALPFLTCQRPVPTSRTLKAQDGAEEPNVIVDRCVESLPVVMYLACAYFSSILIWDDIYSIDLGHSICFLDIAAFIFLDFLLLSCSSFRACKLHES